MSKPIKLPVTHSYISHDQKLQTSYEGRQMMDNRTGQAQGEGEWQRLHDGRHPELIAWHRKNARGEILYVEHVDIRLNDLETRLSQALEEIQAKHDHLLEVLNDLHAVTEERNAAQKAARVAAAKAALADEIRLVIDSWPHPSAKAWLSRYDALAPAADATEETN
jgi:hypothetical protein